MIFVPGGTMRKSLPLLAIVLVSGLSLAFTLSNETSQTLEDYKQIVAENQSYRIYGAESGLKGNAQFQFSEASGYRWYTSNDNGFKIYRFNGIRFDDVLAGDKTAAKDTILPVLIQSKPSHTVYAAGKHYLYEWMDFQWKKYSFPQHDRILKLREYNDDIYCIGAKGLGTLKKGRWTYRSYKTMITPAEANIAQAGTNGVVYSLVLSKQSDTPFVYLKQFSALKTGLMPIARMLSGAGTPKMCFDYTNELIWIYQLGTDLLYKYSTRNMQVEKIALDSGETIQSITAADNSNIWLITNTLGRLKASELSQDYPGNKDLVYSSAELAFKPDYLDYIYLEGQLIRVSTDSSNPNYSLVRIFEPNLQTGLLQAREHVNPLGANICKHVYSFDKLLLLDLEHDKFSNVSRVLILKFPFERFIQRDLLLDYDTYDLSYNKDLDFILHQRKAKLSIVPLVIVCEQVPDLKPPALPAKVLQASGTRLDSDNFYYMYNEAWQTLDMQQFEVYGKLGNIISLNGIFWISFHNAILRHDPKSKESYAYTSREGVPDDILAVYASNGKLMISTRDAVYKFNEYGNKLKLDMPYIVVSDSLKYGVKSKLILPYSRRRVEVPISILGPLYPELCPVTYRLKGYDDDWAIREGQAKIRYAKLPIGSYVFEAYATAANGERTAVQSFSLVINAPWYYTIYAILFYILLGFGFVFLIYRWRLHYYKEANRQLDLQVAERTHELQEWQLRMTQSIDYALLIQKSILPQDEQMKRMFKDHFVLWHPRDTVGGDFYWLHELVAGKAILFAVIDCTGHGVPGALVSMTVNSALNHIVKDHGVNTPEEILKQLHQDIGLTLHQESEKTQQDGLDISLLKIDFASSTLSFAGAALDMLLYEQGSNELVVLKGSKYSIGGLKHRKTLIIEPQQLSFTPNSKVYLYTDGILDQTNEINLRMKRLGPEQWHTVIREMGDKSLQNQKIALEKMIKQMLLLDDQRDDITVVGLQL